ncbi:conserved hypothetical protein, secreted [Candidatus Magnetomorum sp. HK-1]|nr:conserved hypothetical protein, secreted [Candidatus Magnetomorum sp. HK-1]
MKQSIQIKRTGYIFLFLIFFITSQASAITWTYYDIDNKILQSPTQEEIDSMAIMRVSDTGVTQYILEINHDFSGTWGTGYLENIGNPSPGVGKHWINADEEVLCNVDGIVQDVYNLNSRFISTGYFAKGAPNTKDQANALSFDGIDDYVESNISINNPNEFTIEFMAKRDKTQKQEYIIAHKDGFQIGFNSADRLVFETPNGIITAGKPTYTGWHHWKFVYSFYDYTYNTTFGKGVKLVIYRDGEKLAEQSFNPECNTTNNPYQETVVVEYCEKPDRYKSTLYGWSSCQAVWGNYGDGYFQHPMQICKGYYSPPDNTRCTECFGKSDYTYPKSDCNSYWWAYGSYHYTYDPSIYRRSDYGPQHMMRNKAVNVSRNNYSYLCNSRTYNLSGALYIGKGYSTSNMFKGQMKDIVFRVNERVVRKWDMNDGNQSSIALDTSGNKQNGTLKNFNTASCWVIDPKLSKLYEYEMIQERQSIPKFVMNSPSKIIYDWGRQHAVIINTLPENLSKLSTVNVMADESQLDYTGSGKYWYNHGSNLIFTSSEDSCQQLTGYRNNVTDPNETIYENSYQINSLESPASISWVYSFFIFDETVELGSPILLTSVPPDTRQNIDTTQKPRYISEDIEEKDMFYWNSAEKRMFPLRGGETFDIEYDLKDATCEGVKVIVRVNTKWPDSPHIIHVANTPPVLLDPVNDDEVSFIEIKHVEADATVSGNKFTATKKGRSVLHFKRNYIENTLPKEISLAFDGKGYVERESIGLAYNFTIEFYARRTKNDDYQVIIGQGISEYGKSIIIGFNDDNTFFFEVMGDILKTKNTFTDNEWHHWACVSEYAQSPPPNYFQCRNDPYNYNCKWRQDGCYTTGYKGAYDYYSRSYSYNMRYYNRYMGPPWNSRYYAYRVCNDKPKRFHKIYCDGILVTQKETQITYNTTGNLRIGMNAWNETAGYKGQIDDVRIWNCARTLNEISNMKDNSLTGNENNLVAYYPMDRIGSSFIEDKRMESQEPKIAILKNLDPSNAWHVDTDKPFALDPSKISVMGKSCVRVVQTRMESENNQKLSCTIGYEIEGPPFHDVRVPHNGYVFFDKVPYNANIYNREAMQGSIYPVNISHPANDARDNILIIWYQLQDGVSWPYLPVEYQSNWPIEQDPRIVIASRMGSEGKNLLGKDQIFPDVNDNKKNYFDPARYSDILIYNQPNTEAPGYNPNEEHAVVSSSFRHSSASPCPQAAFALRNDLNITTDDKNYTSHPFVLVQYYDKVLGKHGMKAFKVIKDDLSCGYTFQYDMKAGDPVVAPYPLNEIIAATPPAEIYGKNSNSDQKCYWKDHKGQSWAISGAGQSLEIAEVSVKTVNTDSVDYLIKLKSHTMNDNGTYLIKVLDQRGFVGMMKFKIGKSEVEKNKSSVYVDAQEISQLGSTSFVVTLRPGSEDLVLSNFSLYHYENDAQITSYFWYPIQPSFWLNENTPGDGSGSVGVSIPWLPNGSITSQDDFPTDMINKAKAVEISYNVAWPDTVPIIKSGETLTFSGGEYRTDNTESPGLPGALAWATGQLVYDSLNPEMNTDLLFEAYSARIIPALEERTVELLIDNFPEDLKPASGRTDVIMNQWFFKGLHAGLKKRIFYDPMTQKLGIRGFINDKTLGDNTLTASPTSIYVLQPNILTSREKVEIKNIEGADNNFKDAVDKLFALTQNPNQLNSQDYSVGLEKYTAQINKMLTKHAPKAKFIKDMYLAWLGKNIVDNSSSIIPEISYGPGLAVVPNAAFLDPNNSKYNNIDECYITLAENNHPDMGALPVSIHVVKIVRDKVRGAIKTMNSDNVFDEKITLRHSADFGAHADDLIFQWRYREDDGNDQPTPEKAADKWLAFPDPSNQNGLGMSEICLAGAGAVLLVDNIFYVRYRHKNSPDTEESWSDWAGAANSKPGNFLPQLAEGWVKRVLNAVNPFEARIKDFSNTDSPATYVSMIRQAGARYEGPVAFNPAKDVIENVGLIELYETVLNRAMDLSINLEQPVSTSGITSALLLATTRIVGFYMLLGNEAYIDAQDPTIGFGSNSVEYGSLAPTIFSFMNQLPSLLDEEISLLCGREETGARPAYNRLLWNFTKSEGEAAYALSYNIPDADKNGLINEKDAAIIFPQGHGDAWGHYLTATKKYYDLMSHPYFNWESRSEKFSLNGSVIDVDYMDERKFIEAAAAKAKVGKEIINVIYRSKYVESPDAQWQGYKDTDQTKAWGVSGWARRAYLGTLFDWTMANAILPSEDTDPTHKGIKKIDRTTVTDILEIASQSQEIHQQFENANNGLNPLGLATDVVPFDINPARMTPEVFNNATHFEQIYERTLDAMKNARTIFDQANDLKNRIRMVAVSEQDFNDEVLSKDREYRNRLIEIFGTPYEGTIGAGKAYPAGYKGPDYYYYNYIDVNEVSEDNVPPPSEEMEAYFKPMDENFMEDESGQSQNDLPYVYKQYYDADLEGADYMKTDFSDAIKISFPLSTGKYSFHAPQDWGLRKAPGELQSALTDLLKAEVDLQLALFDYSELVNDISDNLNLLKARSDLNATELKIGEEWSDDVEDFNTKIIGLQRGAEAAEIMASFIGESADAAAEYLPRILGAMGADTTAPARGALKSAGAAASKLMKLGSYSMNVSADALSSQKELAQIDSEMKLKKAQYRYEVQQQLEEIEGLMSKEGPRRLEIFKKRESMRQASDKYRAILAKGLRLLDERKAFNAKVARKTQGKRYMDMAFRLNLNKALSKYKSAFDLAARYVYLTAKAYDYDTNLSDRDPASAKPFLSDIVRQRHLGQYEDDQYIIGQGGLGDILATMKINYSILKEQMGFNSPQKETGRFSVRSEMFRIKHGEDNRDAWITELKKKRVENVWNVPEFRKFCRPFAPESEGEQPAIVITFATNVLFGKNYFGWPLSGGDHAYDPTNFATKVRSIGLWFESYENSLLSETPRVYLIPVGMDVMMVPNSTELDTREWSVVDQKIPIPLPVRDSNLNNPDWIPSMDSLDGSMIQLRKFSSFRAYHDHGYFDMDQVSFESRLVGRSVWNTRWIIIIPGGTFHYDANYGLDTFIDNVTDIKLFFQTYAISGN